jgi:hypothetical protein
MVAWAATYAHKVLGTLDNGKKIVNTTVTMGAGAGEDAGMITITPLKRIDKYVVSWKTHKAAEPLTIFAAGTNQNQVSLTPGTGGIGNAVFEILAFGV